MLAPIIPTTPSAWWRSRPPSLCPAQQALKGLSAPAASEGELALVHTEAHAAFIRDLCAAGGGAIDADTYVGQASYQAALHAARGACMLVRALSSGQATTGFCALRPAGHHAERDRAMGFCLFNNVSIAAELAIRTLGVRKVMIIDWDVHHGNGTAEIFSRQTTPTCWWPTSTSPDYSRDGRRGRHRLGRRPGIHRQFPRAARLR